ncbi:MAG: flagellar motor switch phosphatase FliY [Syntrophomonadaceae bacterium]|jgi:flagellar motor switch protein FliN/FliY|nr:flagellar motor switch phosphatase FliY [Syntrophomonadaceae bacterium]
MNDGMLSQAEIDALLNNSSDDTTENEEFSVEKSSSTAISPEEQDTLGEIGNICMGSAATALSTLLNKRVVITTPMVVVTERQFFAEQYTLPFVVVQVRYREGLDGANILFIKESDACIIADLMMGGDGYVEKVEVNEIMLSAVAEAMNQMVGSSTTSLSSMFKMRIDIEPPIVNVAEMKEEILNIESLHDELVCIKFKMEIEGLINSEIIQIIPMESVQNIMRLANNSAKANTAEAVTEDNTDNASNTKDKVAASPVPPPVYREDATGYNYNKQPAMGSGNDVQQVQFTSLQGNTSTIIPQNIDLIMDVPLDVAVELGKTRMTIKEVLDLQQGSIIQLEKMAGEPVDMLVNGKLIAKGEVVVIDEFYGIRITTIVSPIDRVNKLQ